MLNLKKMTNEIKGMTRKSKSFVRGLVSRHGTRSTYQFYAILMFISFVLVLRIKYTSSLASSISFSEKAIDRTVNTSSANRINSTFLLDGPQSLLLDLKKNAKAFSGRIRENKQILDAPVGKLIRKSHDTGMFLHNDKGQLLCGTETLKVLILILSNYYELDLRMKIRKTWANKNAATARYIRKGDKYMEFKWRKLFVISHPDDTWKGVQFVRAETMMQPDILEVEIQEHGTTRGPKLYSALRWVLNNCNFQYIMYTTAQHFVNLPALYDFFHTNGPMGHVYAGHVITEYVEMPHYETRNKDKSMVKKLVSYVAGNSAILSYKTLQTTIDKIAFYSIYTSIDLNIMVAAAMENFSIQPRNITSFTKITHCKIHRNFIQNYESDRECFEKLLFQN